MASTPNETLLEGKAFSWEAGGNWTRGKGQGTGCVAFGACDIHSSTTGTKKGGDRSVSPYLDIRRGREDSRLLQADWSRAVLLPEQSEMNNETGKWVVVYGGRGEHDQSLTWGWEWLSGRRTV